MSAAIGRSLGALGALALAVFTSSMPARADGPGAETASLGWSRLPGAESCATAIELGEAVESMLGRDVLVAAPDAALSLEGRIERVEQGFRATVVVTRRGGASEGERVYEHAGHDCAAATEPLALILALLIDPDADVLERSDTTTPPEAAPIPVSPPPASPPAAPSPPDARARAPFGVAVDLSGALTAFVTPSAAGAGRSAISLRFPSGPLPLAVVVAGWVSPWSRADAAGGAWSDFVFALGGAGLCVVPELTQGLELAVCALGQAGGAFVVGQHQLAPSERERVIAFFEASVTLRGRLYDALTAHVGASLLVPLRTEPWLAATGPFWQPDPVGFSVFLGLGFDIGFGR